MSKQLESEHPSLDPAFAKPADKQPRRILPDKPALVALVKASKVLDGLESDEQRAFVLQSLTALYGAKE